MIPNEPGYIPNITKVDIPKPKIESARKDEDTIKKTNNYFLNIISSLKNWILGTTSNKNHNHVKISFGNPNEALSTSKIRTLKEGSTKETTFKEQIEKTMIDCGFAADCYTYNSDIMEQIQNVEKSETPLHTLMDLKEKISNFFKQDDIINLYKKIPGLENKEPENLSAQNYLMIAEYLPTYQKEPLKELANNLVILQGKSLDRLQVLISEWNTSIKSIFEGPVNAPNDRFVRNELIALNKLRDGLRFRITGQLLFFRNDLDKMTKKINNLITSVATVDTILQQQNNAIKETSTTNKFQTELKNTIEKRRSPNSPKNLE